MPHNNFKNYAFKRQRIGHIINWFEFLLFIGIEIPLRFAGTINYLIIHLTLGIKLHAQFDLTSDRFQIQII